MRNLKSIESNTSISTRIASRILACLVLGSPVAALAQAIVHNPGLVSFVNTETAKGGGATSHLVTNGIGGPLLVGTQFVAQLYYMDTAVNGLRPITATLSQFRPASTASLKGTWNGPLSAVALPPGYGGIDVFDDGTGEAGDGSGPNPAGTGPGYYPVTLQVVAWDSTTGPTWELATYKGQSPLFTYTQRFANGGGPPAMITDVQMITQQGFAVTLTNAVLPVCPTNGLVAYYPFNGNLNDEALAHAHGGISNGIGVTFVRDRFGFTNSAVSFDGTGGQIELPFLDAVVPTTTRPMSVSFWARRGVNGTIVSKYSNGAMADSSFAIQWSSNFNDLQIFGNGIGAFQVSPATAPSWSQFVVVYANGPNACKVYRDGAFLASSTLSLNPNVSTTKVLIGKMVGLSPDNEYRLSGGIDDLRIYNRQMDDVDVANLYQWDTTLTSGPVITQEPQSQSVWLGSNVTLSVTVTGTPPIQVQWQHNGTNLPGAVAATLVLTNVQLEMDGLYSVTTANSLGATNSDPVMLTVLAVPSIISQPKAQAGYVGQSLSLAVGAKGSQPLAYQWFKDGVSISAGTGPTLTLTNLDVGDAGSYFVIITNRVGSVTSSPATLIVSVGIAFGLYPGVTITGLVARAYGVDYTTNVSQTTLWTRATNLTLVQPVQLWVDTSADAVAPNVPRRFYRVVATP